MKNHLFLFFLILCGLVHGNSAVKPTYYLNPEKTFTQYSYHNWTTESGLPTNSLLHLCQSSDGYLWITSYSGLIRFDGLKFKVFSNVNTPVFSSNVIRNIVEDKKGTLWISTQGNGLLSYKNGVFEKNVPSENLNHLYRGLLADSKNRIWSASPDHGWFYLENGKANFLNYSKPLRNIEVRAITEGKNGEIWFATLGEGLFKYENGELVSFNTSDGLKDNWIYSLAVDSANNLLFIGTSKGICTYNGSSFMNILPEIDCTVNKVGIDRYENIWAGTTNGLYRYNNSNKKLENFNQKKGLAGNFIVDFLFDREGNFWITHYKGGLSRIKDGKFTNYTEDGGLPGRIVNSVCEFDQRRYVLGFDNGRLAEVSNNQVHEFSIKTNLNENRIRHILFDSKKNLWISTYLGLLQKKPDGTEIWFDKLHGIKDSRIRLTYEDSKGNLWIGTRNSGLIKVDANNKLSYFSVENGLSSNLIMAITEDNKGTIWIGTSEGQGGLNSISDNGAVTAYTSEMGFGSDIVFNLYCDKEGTLWIASTRGLWLFHRSKFYNINTDGGLAASSIFDVIEDDFGSIWMPYEEGIIRVGKQEIISFIRKDIDKIKCRLYNSSDGMSIAECNPTAQALKTSSGKLIFPTLDGISVIDPIDELVSNYLPPVVIEEFKFDDSVADMSKPLVFGSAVKRFTVTYTAISLYDTNKIKFRYKLDGFDSNWVETDNLRTVSFTNLEPGDYTFSVSSTNSDGIWADSATHVHFTITPLFYQTSLFYVFLVLTLALFAYVFYYIHVTNLKHGKIMLEKSVTERTKEIMGKNTELEKQKKEIENKNRVLSFQKVEIENQSLILEKQKEELNESNNIKDKIFSIISHDLRGPIGNIKNVLDLLIIKYDEFDDKKKKRIIESLSEITKSAFFLTDNLLSWSRSKRGLINYTPQMFLVEPVVAEAIEMSKHSFVRKKINITSFLDPSTLVYSDPNMVKTIFRNLLENAIKFTPENGIIKISAELRGNMVEFSIADSGVGMEQAVIDSILSGNEVKSTYGTSREKGSGLGLIICKDFLNECGGSFKIESQIGQGSNFVFTLKRFQV